MDESILVLGECSRTADKAVFVGSVRKSSNAPKRYGFSAFIRIAGVIPEVVDTIWEGGYQPSDVSSSPHAVFCRISPVDAAPQALAGESVSLERLSQKSQRTTRQHFGKTKRAGFPVGEPCYPVKG
jgi:hypothetical protein